ALRPGDPVVVTELDHHANVDPWKALAAERGVDVRVARMDPGTGTLDMDDYARTVATLLGGGSDPVITAEPEGAVTSAVTDAAFN
ncbi:MAG: aminotransferase class V-fold PLP-dependent enzyme, partial [Roseinatronobacter sp.]